MTGKSASIQAAARAAQVRIAGWKRLPWPPLLFALCFLLVLFLYCGLSRYWVSYGGLYRHLLTYEIPVALAIAVLLFPYGRKQTLHMSIILAACAAYPVLVVYAATDAYFGYFRHAMRLSDIADVPTLWEVSGTMFATVALTLASLVAVPVLSFVIWARRRVAAKPGRQILIRCALLVGLATFLLSPPGYAYQKNVVHFHDWSARVNLKFNGRICCLFYYENRKRENYACLGSLPAVTHAPAFTATVGKKRNVHMIILESFLDPRLIKELSCVPSPVFPGMAEFLGEDLSFDIGISPVYGGASAQAEFELLTGLPALAEIDSIEFNVMDGYETDSFVRYLTRQGYRAIVMMGSSDNFFNSERAFRSLGFDELHFVGRSRALRMEDGARHMSDADLLDQNRAYVAREFLSKGLPVFNCVMGMYGHYPYRGPENPYHGTVKCRGRASARELGETIADLFYERTKTLHEHLRMLQESDPEAIVVVVSDHLPPVFGSAMEYSRSDYENILLVLDAGKRVRTSDRRYYEIPYLIAGLLSGRELPVPDEEELRARYYELLASGSGAAGG